MKRLKIGVIGCGIMGGYHIKQYRNISVVDLIGAADSDPSKRIEGVPFFSDYADLLNIADAVSIVTPTSTHHEIANKALDMGVSVLIEKPIAMNTEDGERLIKKAKSKRLTLTVGHIERFSPVYMKLEQELKGKPLLIIDIKRFSPFPARISDVSCVMDIMIHDIDLALKLAGSPVEQVSAVGKKIRTERLDTAQAVLVFKNGTIANIGTSRVNEVKVRQIIAVAGDKIYEADLLNKQLKEQTTKGKRAIPIDDHDQLNHELMCFASAVLKNRTPVVTGEDALKALDIATRVEEAALRS